MKVEMWALSQLKQYDNNPRLHPPAQIDQIANSIREFGFNAPILVESDGTIIAGHDRVAAAHQLKMEKCP